MDNATKLLNAVTQRPQGYDIHELMNITGLTHEEIKNAYVTLLGRGVHLVAFSVGDNVLSNNFDRGYIKRIYLSKYDPKYNELMKA